MLMEGEREVSGPRTSRTDQSPKENTGLWIDSLYAGETFSSISFFVFAYCLPRLCSDTLSLPHFYALGIDGVKCTAGLVENGS